jgi:methionyl-tRNA synthetase
MNATDTYAATFFSIGKLIAAEADNSLTNYRMRLLKLLERKLNTSVEAVEKFHENLVKNPVYAFEWADAAMEASAMAQYVAQSVSAMENGATNVQVYEEWQRELVRQATAGTSSSFSHNAMAKAKTIAVAYLVNEATYL